MGFSMKGGPKTSVISRLHLDLFKTNQTPWPEFALACYKSRAIDKKEGQGRQCSSQEKKKKRVSTKGEFFFSRFPQRGRGADKKSLGNLEKKGERRGKKDLYGAHKLRQGERKKLADAKTKGGNPTAVGVAEKWGR